MTSLAQTIAIAIAAAASATPLIVDSIKRQNAEDDALRRHYDVAYGRSPPPTHVWPSVPIIIAAANATARRCASLSQCWSAELCTHWFDGARTDPDFKRVVALATVIAPCATKSCDELGNCIAEHQHLLDNWTAR